MFEKRAEKKANLKSEKEKDELLNRGTMENSVLPVSVKHTTRQAKTLLRNEIKIIKPPVKDNQTNCSAVT